MLRYLCFCGLVVLTALAPAACGSDPETGGQPDAPPAVAPGTAADVAGGSVRVVDTMTASRIVLEGGSDYEAEGTFFLVRLAVEAAGAEAARLSDREVALLGGDGETYRIDSGGTMAIVRGNNQTSQFDPAKPNGLYGPIDVLQGTPADLTAVFDIPDAAVSGARLQVGPEGSALVFELDPDGSVDPSLTDLGVRLEQ